MTSWTTTTRWQSNMRRRLTGSIGFHAQIRSDPTVLSGRMNQEQDWKAAVNECRTGRLGSRLRRALTRTGVLGTGPSGPFRGTHWPFASRFMRVGASPGEKNEAALGKLRITRQMRVSSRPKNVRPTSRVYIVGITPAPRCGSLDANADIRAKTSRPKNIWVNLEDHARTPASSHCPTVGARPDPPKGCAVNTVQSASREAVSFLCGVTLTGGRAVPARLTIFGWP
jgi:hypothetical protein